MEQIKNYNVNAEIIASEFGDITYYELLKDVIQKVNTLITEWNIKDVEVTTFINTITKQQTDFENAIKLLTSTFITNITNQQTTFETKITKQQNDFESAITLWQSEFENKFNGLYETFTSEINTTVTNFTTDMTNKYNILSNEFKVLKLYVETYLQSDEFKAQIVVEVNRYLNTPEFTQEIHDLVVPLISETGVIKVNGNIELDNNKEYMVKDSTGIARNVATLNSNDEVRLGSEENQTVIQSLKKPTWLDGATEKEIALKDELNGYLSLSGGRMNGNIQLNNGGAIIGYDRFNDGHSLISIAPNNDIVVGDVQSTLTFYSDVRPSLLGTSKTEKIAFVSDIDTPVITNTIIQTMFSMHTLIEEGSFSLINIDFKSFSMCSVFGSLIVDFDTTVQYNTIVLTNLHDFIPRQIGAEIYNIGYIYSETTSVQNNVYLILKEDGYSLNFNKQIPTGRYVINIQSCILTNK